MQFKLLEQTLDTLAESVPVLTPELAYCAYGPRVPALCVLHVPKAQGSLP